MLRHVKIGIDYYYRLIETLHLPLIDGKILQTENQKGTAILDDTGTIRTQLIL